MQLKHFSLTLGLAASLCLSAWAAPNFKTLTDAPRDTGNNVVFRGETNRRLSSSDGSATLLVPNGWFANHSGAMGADFELFNERQQTRLGVWEGQSIEGKAPRQLVGEWTSNLKSITGGEWSTPRTSSIGGIPVVQAFGVDQFGNYYYRVISFTKFGQNFALAMRTPFENRWNHDLRSDVASIIANSHPGGKGLPKLMHDRH